MFHQHSFGLSCRTRGVDDVGKVRQCRVHSGHATRRWWNLFPPDNRGSVLWQAICKTLPGQDQGWVCIFDHHLQPFAWKFRVERQIGPSRLENAENGHHGFHALGQEKSHGPLRLHSQLHQPLREPVCLVIQLPISHAAPRLRQGNSIRLAGRPLLEQLMYTSCDWALRRRAPPSHQTLPFIGGQHQTGTQPVVGSSDHLIQQSLPMARHCFGRSALEQHSVVMQLTLNGIPNLTQ